MAKRSYLDDIPEAYLECRANRSHTWRTTQLSQNRRSGVWHQVRTCQECTTERVITLSAKGFILTSHYNHPDGYLLKSAPKGGITPEDRGTLRIRMFTHELQQSNPRPRKGRKVATS